MSHDRVKNGSRVGQPRCLNDNSRRYGIAVQQTGQRVHEIATDVEKRIAGARIPVVLAADAAGVEQRFFETPEPMCTSLCFGGPDLKQLFAVTGSDGTDSDRSGCVYVMDCDVVGMPVPLSKVTLG